MTAEETNTVSIDNVTLIRNMMEEKDWNKTIGGNAGGDETFKLVEYVNGESPTTEIGTSDCSAAWWTQFSDYYRIPAGATLHLKFENHTSNGLVPVFLFHQVLLLSSTRPWLIPSTLYLIYI